MREAHREIPWGEAHRESHRGIPPGIPCDVTRWSSTVNSYTACMPSQFIAKIYSNHYLDAWIATSAQYDSNSELVTCLIWSDKKHFYLDNRCHRLLWALTWHIVVTRSVVDDVPKSQRQYDDKRQTEDDDSCGDDATAATPRRRIVLRLQSRNNTFLTFKWSYCVYFARRVEKNNIRRLLLINFDSRLKYLSQSWYS